MACFSRQGYHLTKMDDIAAEAGLSKGSLYWYFKGKKKLFLSLFQEMMDPFGQTWETIVNDENSSATEKLMASLNFFSGELGEMATFFGVMMEAWAQTRHDDDVVKLLDEFYQPYLAMMTQIIEEGVANQEFQVESPEATALVIMSLFDGITLALGTGIVQFDWNLLVKAAGDLVLRGLGVERN